MRSRRSRIAVVTANVIVSPVRSASSRARRCVSSSLMLRRIFGGPSISAEYTRAADAHQIGGAPGGLPPNAPYHASRPVSRVLYGAKQERTLRATAIPLERRLPGVSSNLPGRPIRTSIRGFLPVPPLFGLAPGGVYRAACVAAGAVRSCRTVSPLPRDFHPEAVCVFCGTFPGVTPAGRYPAPHVHGARTFLPGDLSVLAGTAVRPTDEFAGKHYRPVGQTVNLWLWSETPGGTDEAHFHWD